MKDLKEFSCSSWIYRMYLGICQDALRSPTEILSYMYNSRCFEPNTFRLSIMSLTAEPTRSVMRYTNRVLWEGSGCHDGCTEGINAQAWCSGWSRCLRPFAYSDRGFRSHLRHVWVDVSVVPLFLLWDGPIPHLGSPYQEVNSEGTGQRVWPSNEQYHRASLSCYTLCSYFRKVPGWSLGEIHQLFWQSFVIFRSFSLI